VDTTLHAIYSDERMAQQAIQQLLAIGIEQQAIRLMSTVSLADTQRDHLGSYADNDEHMHGVARDHVGGYADSGEHMHTAARDHVGGYADSGEHMHTAARDQVGSFASVERGPTRAENMADQLQAAGLTAEQARAYGARVDAGGAVLLVQVSPDQVAQVAEILRAG
jgi:hypothetical protein